MQRWYKLLLALGMLGTLAGSSSAQLFDPGDVLVTSSPYTGQDLPAGILAVNPMTGDQDVVSSGGLFVVPFDMRVAPDGTLIVLDGSAGDGNGAIISVDPKSGQQKLVTSAGLFDSYDGTFGAVHVDAAGTIYVGLSGAGVFQVDPGTGNQTLLAAGGSIIAPSGLASTPEGNLYVGDYKVLGGALFMVDAKSGAETLLASGGMINGVVDIAVEPTGTVLIENGDNSIVRVDPASGTQTLVTAGLSGLNGIGVGGDGQIYVSSSPSSSDPSSILRIDPVSGNPTVIATAGNLGFLGGLVQAP